MPLKTVFITGCSTGIGRALAREFLQQGFKVYASARTLTALAELQHERLIPLQVDVNQPAAIDAAVNAIVQDSGYLNVLVNNAGYAAMGPVVELDSTALAQQFATNVFAPMALVRACLPLLRVAAQQGQPAQVVNMGSVSGILTTPFAGAYCATKSALHSLSDALRLELKPFGIEVITVQPGGIESEFGNNSAANLEDLIGVNSIYAPLTANIKARATASQENPTPTHTFAHILVTKLQQRPKAELRIGHGSTLLPFLKQWLPTVWVDKILAKKFGLSKLG